MSSELNTPMTMRSNLQSFLLSVTPTVPSKFLPQSGTDYLNSLWHPINKGAIEYFILGDLWEYYDEWSAYGAGAPIVLNNGDNVVQYYVPYLSGIQIYTNKSSLNLRNNPREDIDMQEWEIEFWSDDSESDKLSRSLSNNSSKGWNITSVDSSIDHDGSWSIRDRLGYLYFQFYDICSPYWRIPLVDRIAEFAQNYPGITTLKSVDLSPASWMAVAWYPIYHIPTKGSMKELSTCFLTYHTLSSSFQADMTKRSIVELYAQVLNDFDLTDNVFEDDLATGKNVSCSGVVEEIVGGKSKSKGNGEISLPPFGLATYKLEGNLWMNPDASDHERLIYLQSAADSWLKQLNVQHHDFNFFTTHSNMELGMFL